MKKSVFAAAFSLAVSIGSVSLLADTVTFTGNGDGSDLADIGNWSQQSWTANDLLSVPLGGFAMPTDGLSLSSDLPSSGALRFVPSSSTDPVKVDFGGHSLNLYRAFYGGPLNTSSGRVPLIASGGFSGVPRIRLGLDDSDNRVNRAVLHLTNGTFTTVNGFDTLKGDYSNVSTVWYPELHILTDATLAITSVANDSRVGFSDGTAKPRCYIKGGTLRIDGRDDWDVNRQILWAAVNADNKGLMQITNGGTYIDNSTSPADNFSCFDVSVDGGSIIQTNCVPYTSSDANKHRDGYRTILWTAKSRTFTVESGTIKVPRIKIGRWIYDWRGRDYGVWDGFSSSQTYITQDNVFTFRNSTVVFAFAPSYAQASAGIALSPASLRNKVSFLGASGSCTAHDFLIYGYTNSFEVADGTFAVNGHLVAGIGDACSVTFTNCTAQIAEMPILSSATNFTLGVKGTASVSVGGGLSLASPGARVEFCAGSPSLSFGNGLDVSGGATLCFAVPAGGWSSAPLKSTGASSGSSIASNTRFEFDLSAYTVPKRMTFIPLIRSEGGFTAVDLAALTSANAARLPSDRAGEKGRLALKDGGKTLCLALGCKGIVVNFH